MPLSEEDQRIFTDLQVSFFSGDSYDPQPDHLPTVRMSRLARLLWNSQGFRYVLVLMAGIFLGRYLMTGLRGFEALLSDTSEAIFSMVSDWLCSLVNAGSRA